MRANGNASLVCRPATYQRDRTSRQILLIALVVFAFSFGVGYAMYSSVHRDSSAHINVTDEQFLKVLKGYAYVSFVKTEGSLFLTVMSMGALFLAVWSCSILFMVFKFVHQRYQFFRSVRTLCGLNTGKGSYTHWEFLRVQLINIGINTLLMGIPGLILFSTLLQGGKTAEMTHNMLSLLIYLPSSFLPLGYSLSFLLLIRPCRTAVKNHLRCRSYSNQGDNSNSSRIFTRKS